MRGLIDETRIRLFLNIIGRPLVSTHRAFSMPPLHGRHCQFSQSTLKILLVVAMLGCLCPQMAPAQSSSNTGSLDIVESHWGFDGTVMTEHFCLLTLIVDNPTPQPFDGEIRLHRTDGSGKRVGGFLVESIYLNPGSRRIVQFEPYIISENDGWVVSWEGGNWRAPNVQRGTPGRVLLINEDGLFERGGAVRRFRERFFPSSVTACDGLGEVILDHVPDWDAPRRQAFLDWLRQGGRLHLLRSPARAFPQFDGELSALNEPSLIYNIGGGIVRRHEITRRELTETYLKNEIIGSATTPMGAEADLLEQLNQRNEYSYDTSLPMGDWTLQEAVLNDLKRLITPEHDWGMIHLLSLAYIAVLFPGSFIVGREFRRVPLTLGVIVGSTLLFGGAFFLVGNRGYGEASTQHSLAIARHVEGDQFHVMQWNNLFMTNGGYYQLWNNGAGRLYSDATNLEAVNGQLISGSEGRFLVDIPPYSSRVFANKTLVHLPAWEERQVSSDTQDAEQFNVPLPEDIAKSIRYSYVIIGSQLYEGSWRDNTLTIRGGRKINEVLKPRFDSMGWNNVDTSTAETELATKKYFDALVLYSLGVSTDEELKSFALPEQKARVFLFTNLAPELSTKINEELELPSGTEANLIERQTGQMVYIFDVPHL